MCRGKGYVGTLYFSLKFAVNLKNSLKKKGRKEKTRPNEGPLGKRWYTFEALSARTAYGKSFV